MNRNFEQVGPELSAFMHMDSDVYNPEFAYFAEVREPALPLSLTLMLKVSAHLKLVPCSQRLRLVHHL